MNVNQTDEEYDPGTEFEYVPDNGENDPDTNLVSDIKDSEDEDQVPEPNSDECQEEADLGEENL